MNTAKKQNTRSLLEVLKEDPKYQWDDECISEHIKDHLETLQKEQKK